MVIEDFIHLDSHCLTQNDKTLALARHDTSGVKQHKVVNEW